MILDVNLINFFISVVTSIYTQHKSLSFFYIRTAHLKRLSHRNNIFKIVPCIRISNMYKRIYKLRPIRTYFTNANTRPIPICIHCEHFMEHTTNYPYDPLPDNSKYGRCKKFGEINIVTGEIQYELASNSRSNYRQCGKDGTEFTRKIKS
jgi:hypothetical protein